MQLLSNVLPRLPRSRGLSASPGRSLMAALASALLSGALVQAGLAQAAPQAAAQAPLRFVLIPKVSHPWYDVVRQGAEQAGRMIQQQSGRAVVIDYQPPASAQLTLQAQLLEAAIRSRADGITIDLLDAEGLRPLLLQARSAGIALTVFDSEAPADLAIPSIGNDFCQQAQIASQRLVDLLGGKGQVAIMHGVPTAPNHAIRVSCHQQLFGQHPGIQVVATPADNDDIATAEREALATMRRFPALRGWVVADAGGGIGVARAVKALGRQGAVQVVGIDDLPDLLTQIKGGVIDSTSATRPIAQGYWSVLSLWQQRLGAPVIEHFDTGIGVVKGGAQP